MDLEYGPEYQDFTKEVQDFCKKYKGLSFTDGSKNPLGSISSLFQHVLVHLVQF